MSVGRSHAQQLTLLWLVAAGGAVGCAPKPSSTPLGLGPLDVAERAAASQKKPVARARRSAPASDPAAGASPALSASEVLGEDPEVASKETVEATADEPAPGAKAAPAFAGLFAGKDVAIFRIAGLPERQELDDKAQIRIESQSPTELRVVLINSANGSDLCDLSAEIQGNSAHLDGGQPCFSSEGEGAIQAELTSGTVVLNGDRLTMNAEGTLSVALAEEELDGDLSYSFRGRRQ